MSDPISPAADQPDTTSRHVFRTPVEYYSSPDKPRALFPRAVPVGCGIASVTFLLIIFIGGAIVARNGLGRFMGPVLGMIADELDPMYTKDVTPAQRTSLRSEIKTLRENISSEKISVAGLERIMSTLREDIKDQHITPAEAQSLTKMIHDANAAALKHPTGTHAPAAQRPRK